MQKSSLSVLFACAHLFATSPAVASDDVDLEIVHTVLQGQGQPKLVLNVHKRIASAEVELVDEKGKRYTLSKKNLRAGKSHDLPIDVSLGSTRLTGALAVTFADGGKGAMPLEFDVHVLDLLQLTVPKHRVDLEENRLELSLSRPAAVCSHVVLFDGASPTQGTTRFNGEPAGTPLRIEWDEPAGAVVLKIKVECEDTFATTRAVELSPWSLVIPHEDVNFASGSSDIPASETGKLDTALHDIQTAVRRYGDVVRIRLFVAGHTDRVGSASTNDVLSRGRARSIARYFARNGVKVPILYAGFGESRPAVKTADEVPEAANRRAEYVISVDEPEPAPWKAL